MVGSLPPYEGEATTTVEAVDGWVVYLGGGGGGNGHGHGHGHGHMERLKNLTWLLSAVVVGAEAGLIVSLKMIIPMGVTTPMGVALTVDTVVPASVSVVPTSVPVTAGGVTMPPLLPTRVFGGSVVCSSVLVLVLVVGGVGGVGSADGVCVMVVVMVVTWDTRVGQLYMLVTVSVQMLVMTVGLMEMTS